jgi:5-(carboxyamino)imidazole ribonucleotide mutase
MNRSGDNPLVAIVMGSTSDLPVMESAFDVMEQFGVPYEVRILSAHRTPDATATYAKALAGRGVRALIAGAGWAAHLAGVMAAHTAIPVIGVPIDSSPLNGIDALLATVQMPPGIPVATMAIGAGGAKNAALFAVQVLALGDSALSEQIAAHRKKMTAEIVTEKGRELEEYFVNRGLEKP